MQIISWDKVNVGDRVRLHSVLGTTKLEGVLSELCRASKQESALQSDGSHNSARNAFRLEGEHPLRIFSNWNVVEVLAAR